MKIAFISTYYNHHQSFISQKLYELTDGDYRFIETSSISQERKALGYQQNCAPFVLQYKGQESYEAIEWVNTADIVIAGVAPAALLAQRKKDKKIIFKYSEHILKKGFQFWKYPYRRYKMHKDNPSDVPMYMLCASAYTASDYAKFGLFKGKCYRWGYFPECKRYENFDAVLSSKSFREILWCGRFLDWKHPDDVLMLAEKLRSQGYDFHINIIGTGEMEEQLHNIHREKQLGDCVSFLGSMPPEKVREYMEKSGIYLFTSDHKEGWGAVLNEAMNSGCAVVASAEAGSTKYLIKDSDNGFIYSSKNFDLLYEKVKYLLDHSSEQKRLGHNAYNSIIDEWNPDVAVQRLLKLFEAVLEGKENPDLFEKGPLSRA
ncbi:MAG: glycosyltransferase family 4 protein [Clostridia bacterium]|nr:glycosyltransferase family 4 protein [Clostridia bacterium]